MVLTDIQRKVQEERLNDPSKKRALENRAKKGITDTSGLGFDRNSVVIKRGEDVFNPKTGKYEKTMEIIYPSQSQTSQDQVFEFDKPMVNPETGVSEYNVDINLQSTTATQYSTPQFTSSIVNRNVRRNEDIKSSDNYYYTPINDNGVSGDVYIYNKDEGYVDTGLAVKPEVVSNIQSGRSSISGETWDDYSKKFVVKKKEGVVDYGLSVVKGTGKLLYAPNYLGNEPLIDVGQDKVFKSDNFYTDVDVRRAVVTSSLFVGGATLYGVKGVAGIYQFGVGLAGGVSAGQTLSYTFENTKTKFLLNNNDFDVKSYKEYKSSNLYGESRDVFYSSMNEDRKGKINPVSNFVVENFLDTIGTAIFSKDSVSKARGDVYDFYISKGFTSENALKYEEFTFKSAFISDVKLGAVYTGISRGSEVFSRKLSGNVESASLKSYGEKTSLGKITSEEIFKTSPAGFVEGSSMIYFQEKEYNGKVKYGDVALAGSLGAVVAPAVNIAIRYPLIAVQNKAVVSKVGIYKGKGYSAVPKVISYATDWFEGVGDIGADLSTSSVKRVRTFTPDFSLGIGSTQFSGAFNKPFSTFFTRTNSNNKRSVSNDFVRDLTISNAFTNTLTRSNNFSNTNDFVNDFTNEFTRMNNRTYTFTPKISGFIPPLRGFNTAGFGFGKVSRRKTRYTPSLSALGFNIRAKKQRNELTGIGIRPIVGR